MTTTIHTETRRTRSTPTAVDATPASVRTPVLGRSPKGRRDLTVHELDGEALIFDPRNASTHRLNGTALFIWCRLDGRADTASIAQQLTEQYDVSTEAARTHVETLVATLGEKGLLDLARLGPGG